jgi:hypothetical protein
MESHEDCILVNFGTLLEAVDGAYPQGYYEESPPNNYQIERGIIRVLSYQFPWTAKFGGGRGIHKAAQPKPGLQSADHEGLYGVWTGWNDSQEVYSSVPVVNEVVDEYELLRKEASARLAEKSKSSNEATPQKKARRVY